MPHAEKEAYTAEFIEPHIVINLDDQRSFNAKDFNSYIKVVGTKIGAARKAKFVIDEHNNMYIFEDVSDLGNLERTRKMDHLHVSIALGVADNLACAGRIIHDSEGTLLLIGSSTLEAEGKLTQDKSKEYLDKVLRPKMEKYFSFA